MPLHESTELADLDGKEDYYEVDPNEMYPFIHDNCDTYMLLYPMSSQSRGGTGI